MDLLMDDRLFNRESSHLNIALTLHI
jgi:hypothetical protein